MGIRTAKTLPKVTNPLLWSIGDVEMVVLESLKIRMYRGILGDCFLVRPTVFDGDSRVTKTILIDCGVLQHVVSGEKLVKELDQSVVHDVGKDKLKAVKAGPDQISSIAKDVLNEVKDRIDLLVITHEHYDHLSGFGFTKDSFLAPGLTIERLWLAWTENRNDKQANDLRGRFDQAKEALGSAAALAQTLGVAASPSLQNVLALAAFSLPMGPTGTAKNTLSTADIINMLKAKAGRAATSYLEPGAVIDLRDFGLTAYVLGPPRLEKLLRKDSPSSGTAKEVYLTQLNAAITARSAVTAQLALSGAEVTGNVDRDHIPFSKIHQRLKKDTKHKLYDDKEMEWRKIDDDWTGSIEALALKMDSDTNNTSLALAFELPDGQVLLFPGDAQVGNWRSWNNQTYARKGAKKKGHTEVTAADLLSRVTFYKVGHHGSHNATLRGLGLERMTDPRLTAAIPVVEAVAAIQGKGRTNSGRGWKMPYGPMYQDLKKRTNGRIVRGDGNPDAERQAFTDNPTSKSHPVTVDHNDLWVELTYKFG